MAFTQLELLANYIMKEIPGEPSRSEGAGDTAIRIIKELREQIRQVEGMKGVSWNDLTLKALEKETGQSKEPRCPECDTVHVRLPDGMICHTCLS